MLTFIFFEKEIIDLFVEEISKLKLTKNIYEKIKIKFLKNILQHMKNLKILKKNSKNIINY